MLQKKDAGGNLMATTKQSKDVPIYQLKVALKGSKPPIWRRIQVPGDINLRRLHLVIQEAMGWYNSHLWQFTVGGTDYGDKEWDEWGEMADASKARLQQLVRSEKARFEYLYDFGDSWEHVILVEKILPPEPATRYPLCVTGKRACPPEDCGGIWGYEELLETIQNPDDPEYEEMMAWLGGEFDPEEFDLEAVNRALQRM
jgi:hypothetical protein